MNNNPEIRFQSIKEFKNHCKTNNIRPEIQYNAKKHQNRKNEYLHEINGTMSFNNIVLDFTVDEMVAFPDKKYPAIGGYKLTSLK